MGALTTFDPGTPTEEIVAALRADGAVIVRNLIDPTLASRVADELREHFDAFGREMEDDFNGYKTLRVSAILARSRSAVELIAHRVVLEVLDAVLLPNCVNYRIGSTTGIEILPDEGDQPLHRDDVVYPQRIPDVEWQAAANWALTDFTAENGATRVVPGSHQWPDNYRTPGPDDPVVQATMTQGSALIYLGSAWHGGGANRTDTARMGLVNTYALGWLRQEVNQILSVPWDIAEKLPIRVRDLMGYRSHGPLLGTIPADYRTRVGEKS